MPTTNQYRHTIMIPDKAISSGGDSSGRNASSKDVSGEGASSQEARTQEVNSETDADEEINNEVLDIGEGISGEVTNDPPEWCLPSPSAGKSPTVEEKYHHAVEVPAEGPYFYIDADISQGWPYGSEMALCKLGVTGKPPSVRCQENERDLYQRWNVEADLKPVFVTTGRITTAEKEIVDHTLGWLPSRFQKNSEWRCCPPRELARTALLIAERRHRSGGARREGAGQKTDGDRRVENTTTQQARRRRLSIPGTTVHLEPVPSRKPVPSREPVHSREPVSSGRGDSEEATPTGETPVGETPTGEMPEGRPLREPMPNEGPFKGPFEGPSDQDLSDQGSLAGEASSMTGLAHWWLRQRALFAELRALEQSELAEEQDQITRKTATEASGRDHGEAAFDGKTAFGGKISHAEINQVQASKSELGREEVLSLRLKPACAALLSEAVACSSYQGRSALLRATATGRDRRAPIIAKAGMLFFWARRYFGKEVSLGNEVSLEKEGGEALEALQALSSFLSGLRRVGEALALIRRHLRAAELSAEEKLKALDDPSEKLPPVPGTVKKRVSADPRLTASVRVGRERRRLIEENATFSAYGSRSAYIRHMALGWDRNAQVRAQCASVAEWLESCREERAFEGDSTEGNPTEGRSTGGSPAEESPAEGAPAEGSPDEGGPRIQIGREDWRRLDRVFQQRFGVFLAGPGPRGKADVDGALRRGTRHLLGTDPETFATRMPAAL